MFGHDFPYLDTRDINLDWLLKNMKTVVQQWTEYQISMNTQFSNLTEAFNELKTWIDEYFDNLDVSAEIEQKLDRMAVSGELGSIMRPIVAGEVSDWLSAHITQPTDPVIDSSLTVSGAAADAKVTGDRLNDLHKGLVYADNNSIAGLSENGFIVVQPIWEQGNISNGQDSVSSALARVRTANYIKTADIDYIDVNRTYHTWLTYISYYDVNKTFVTVSSALPGTHITVNKTYPYFRVSIVDNNNGSFSNAIVPSMAYDCYVMHRTSTLHTSITEIESNVDDVTAEADILKGNMANYGNIIFPVYENGNIQNGEDTSSSAAARVRTVGYISTEKANRIKIDRSEYKFRTYVNYYDENYNFISASSSMPNDVININTEYPFFRFSVLDYTDETFSKPISPQTVAEKYLIYFSEAMTDSRVDTIEDYLALDYPSYYNSQISTVVPEIIAHAGSAGKSGTSFIFCTDIHWSQNTKHTPALVNKIINSAMVNKVFLGGDYISQFDEKQTAINNMLDCITRYAKLSEYVFPLQGNHDRNSNGTQATAYMSEGETYAIINAWLNLAVEYGEGYFTYYIDDQKSKTRYICVDTGFQSIDGGVIPESTRTWITTIINALANDWHVVVFAHWLFSPTTWNQPLVNGQLVGSYTASAQALFTALDAINADTSSATVEAIITGHLHCDYNDETTGGIPIVFTDADSLGAYGEYTATAGTASEQCFDVMTINYTSRTIYCDRIGRGISRVISY